MSLFGKHRNNNKQLDALITSVKNNASNNYKDAAQEDFKKFTARFEELEKSGELNDRQREYYSSIKSELEVALKGFHH
ncbi:MAG: hypothetical protein MSH24_06665 [Lachnospiraceae bacterium]|nr:hypothetical protein [Lachnospiraceae bacterium]